jgi:hypothetical protein
MKTLTDKKVNRMVKLFNKELKQDVFKGRFWVRQYQKARVDGQNYYLYELMDREQPERNTLIREWLRGESHFFRGPIWEGMNDFIIKSDFWEKYWREKENGLQSNK